MRKTVSETPVWTLVVLVVGILSGILGSIVSAVFLLKNSCSQSGMGLSEEHKGVCLSSHSDDI